MDWEKLYSHLPSLMTFLSVSRNGTYSAAAEQLGINHATVSRRIAGLEAILGTRLLVSGEDGWHPTEEGLRVRRVAEEIEASLANLAQSDQAGAVSGTIRVGAPDAFAVVALTPALAQLRTRHPALSVEVFSSTRNPTQNSAALDLEIVVGEPRKVHGEKIPLLEYGFSLYASGRYLANYGTPRTIRDLEKHRLNYYTESGIVVRALLDAKAILPAMKTGIASNNVFVHLEATRHGTGIGLLPDFLGSQDQLLIPVLEGEYRFPVEYWAIIRDGALRRPAVTATCAVVRNVCQSFSAGWR
ncbi:LysR family transcriptional regulator [Auritidibacter ignavus]|uniref:LysR family transcriptional regulator n=1 Tax=Auritidibacter ignavus TaxID=678932 RepID=A0AAJ6AIQ6_9MICC|nr:LysR family transcriptional regulator [Auritidibacter ignavus]NIH71032.1 DNA-binding transcriptional LysR family regulator [Auritidibacter ignavus]RMX22980.1 LysR family transcriptional regulator [Auritidibacter ignavus]WGH85773.1 LysR family transcriptional regulator [Auritidibacter ignavus]WGH88060.1 LysR family transcriptional regulator [Auritidibacter ignavus]WGH92747.1 LysR family transcriptional regulator [Auritidibacter ignavus]